MLNDYEIKRNDKILAVLKLLISALGLYIILQLSPSFVELMDESRPGYTEDVAVRVIASSNMEKDQQLKKQVVADMQQFLRDASIKEDGDLAPSIQQFLAQHYPHLPAQLKTGDNLIPPKLFMRTFYPQASTNSLVLVIGSGRGENWFCSVFSAICDDGDTEEPEKEKKKVRFKLIEWFKEKFL